MPTRSQVELLSMHLVLSILVVLLGNDGLFLACEDFGRMFNHSFPVYAFIFTFFFRRGGEWRLARAHLFHSLCQSTVVQQAATTVAECSLTSGV